MSWFLKLDWSGCNSLLLYLKYILDFVTLVCVWSYFPFLPEHPCAKVGINLMLSEPYSSDLTSDFLGVWSSTLRAAKWWRATWSTSPASLVVTLFLAAVRHHGSWSLLRELMHTIPLFALLMALTLQCHSWAHLEHWITITCLFRSMNFPMSCA